MFKLHEVVMYKCKEKCIILFFVTQILMPENQYDLFITVLDIPTNRYDVLINASLPLLGTFTHPVHKMCL